jgi:hypothetical protein
MKNIELTEEHKSKLLEMCKELFPTYNFEFMRGKDEFGFDIYDYFTFYLIEDYENNEWYKSKTDIHWFEFCITKIVNELSWKNIKTDILADCEYEDFRMKLITNIFKDKLTTEKFHIIDYLYEEFKKL